MNDRAIAIRDERDGLIRARDSARTLTEIRLSAELTECLATLRDLCSAGWCSPDCRSQCTHSEKDCDCGMHARYRAARVIIAKHDGTVSP